MFRTVSLSINRSLFLCVQCYTPDDGQRNCSKHVEFHSKNKFEKCLHLVGFYYKNISRYMVFRMSNLLLSTPK